jgi:hypothetical protein
VITFLFIKLYENCLSSLGNSSNIYFVEQLLCSITNVFFPLHVASRVVFWVDIGVDIKVSFGLWNDYSIKKMNSYS